MLLPSACLRFFNVSDCNLKKLDVMYVFDAYAMGQRKSNLILDAISVMMFQTNTEQEKIKSGVLTKSCQSHQDTPLSFYASRKEFLSKATSSISDGLSGLLRKLRHHAYQRVNGGRYDAQNVAVIFVDGAKTDYKKLQTEARRVKFGNRIEVFIVVIGNQHAVGRFGTLCSHPLSEHLIHIESFEKLNTLKSSLLPTFCSGF